MDFVQFGRNFFTNQRDWLLPKIKRQAITTPAETDKKYCVPVDFYTLLSYF